jgi:hypothetical protein
MHNNINHTDHSKITRTIIFLEKKRRSKFHIETLILHFTILFVLFFYGTLKVF